MTRLALTFQCRAQTLAGTLDTAAGKTGLLIVSGGNEIRAGAFGGQARLAGRMAQAGFPVFRFDRRGIGDSDGENRGYRKSEADIAAADEAFRAMCPQLHRVVAWGNCDAASALMLMQDNPFDALILSNPWTIEGEEASGTPSPEEARSRYASKLKNPREWLRLLRGGVNLRKLATGLRQAAKPAPASAGSLVEDMASGLAASGKPATFLLAGADRTAQIFAHRWSNTDFPIHNCAEASHAFVEPSSQEWLEAHILSILRS